MVIGLNHYLILAAALFLTGAAGVLARRNSLIMLMGVEVMLCSVNIVFAAYSRALGDMSGHVFVIMNFAIAAAEAAIGLAILVAIYRIKRSVNADELNSLKE